jgi:regulator of nonsense transcripts 1
MSDPNQPFTINQKIFKASWPTIHVIPCLENELTKSILHRFLNTATDGIIGVAPAYRPHCKLARIAFATRSNVLLVRFSSSKPIKSKRRDRPQNSVTGRELLNSDLFCNTALSKCAFKMDKLATSLFLDIDSRITCGVDLLSTSTADRHEPEALLTTLGGETVLRKREVEAVFRQQESAKASDEHIALQAWAAYGAGMPSVTSKERKEQQRINTAGLATPVSVVFLNVAVGFANALSSISPLWPRSSVMPTVWTLSSRLLYATMLSQRCRITKTAIALCIVSATRLACASRRTRCVDCHRIPHEVA